MILSKIYITKVDDNCYAFSSFEEADKCAVWNRDKTIEVERFITFLDRGVANKTVVMAKAQIAHLIDVIKRGAKKEDILHDIFD